jgi:hypothetical protein
MPTATAAIHMIRRSVRITGSSVEGEVYRWMYSAGLAAELSKRACAASAAVLIVGSGMYTFALGVRSCEDTRLTAQGKLEPGQVWKGECSAGAAEVPTKRERWSASSDGRLVAMVG